MRRTTALMITALTVAGFVSCSEDEQTSSTTQDQTTVAAALANEQGSTPMAVDDGVLQTIDDAGVPYTVIVTPMDPSSQESNAGCIPAADAGQTNIRFGALVGPYPTSEEDRRTIAIPHMEFRLNLNDDGRSIDPTATTFDTARYTDVEARPDGQCDDMNTTGPDLVPWVDSIEVGSPIAIPLTAGPTNDPPPEGIVLYVRVFPADGDVTDMAVGYDP
jgi:hypothetical protein